MKAGILRYSINQLCEDMGFSQFPDNLLASVKISGAQCNQYASGLLCRRALVHSTILHHCLRGHMSGLRSVIEALAEHDPDTLSNAIELLQSLYPTADPASAGTLLDILFRALEISSSSAAKACAANYIAELWESSPLLASRLFADSQKNMAD